MNLRELKPATSQMKYLSDHPSSAPLRVRFSGRESINLLLQKLQKTHLDSLLVSSAANITYLSGYISRDSYLLISKRNKIYFTDSRYTQEAKKALGSDYTIKKADASVFNLITDAFRQLNLKRIGFEERHLSFAEFFKIRRSLDKKSQIIPTHSLVEELRQIKSAPEIEKIRKAAVITLKAHAFAAGMLAGGIKEIEIAAEIERFIRANGASKSAFDIIVAAGANSSFPHHITGTKKLRKSQPLLIDMGVDWQGYKSDLTRVSFLGKMNSLFKEIYGIVKEAQAEAIRRIKPGVKMSMIDSIARQLIAKNGYGDCFGHSLGHGVGLEVHEAPYISRHSHEEIREGMVFTIEPGIYLPGKFGVRIEDMVLVTKKGCEVLSGAINK